MSAPPAKPLSTSVIWSIILALLVLATMGRVCIHEFVEWDDPLTIARNPAFNPPDAKAILAYWSHPAEALYVPLTYSVWGGLSYIARVNEPDDFGSLLNPWIYHSANLVVHVVTTLLVFQILRRLVPNPFAAVIGAAVFAVHPVQVETVAWASGTKDLLCGCFIAAGVLAVVWRRDRGHPREAKQVAAFLFAATVLACLCKPTGVILPLMALVVCTVATGAGVKRSFITTGPSFLAAIVFAVVGRMVQPLVMAQLPALWLRPLIAGDAIAFYVGKLLWPARLCLDYGRTPQVVAGSAMIYVVWLVPAAIAGILYIVRHRMPLVVAGAAIALIGVAPVLGFIPFTFQSYSTVSDHYLYPSMIGVGVIMAAFMTRFDSRPVRIVSAFIVLALSVRGFVAAGAWQNSQSLFTHTLAVNPRSFLAYTNRAVDSSRRGDAWAAERDFRQAIAINPDYSFAHMNLAGVLLKSGDIDGATQEYRETQRIYATQRNYDPTLAAAVTMSLATSLARQGHIPQALLLLQDALARDPNNPQLQAMIAQLQNASPSTRPRS